MIREGSHVWCNLSCLLDFLKNIQSFYVLLKQLLYRKFPKYSDTQNICCNHPKIRTTWLYNWEKCPKHVDGIANSVDPDQSAPLGAVWSGSALFAQTYLCENF